MPAVSSCYRKHFLFFSIYLMMGFCVCSQRNVVDTFESRLQKEPNDSVRLTKATTLAKYFQNIDSAIAWKYFYIAKKIADKENTPLSKITLLELEGVLYTKDNPARAYVLYQEAISMCQELEKNLTSRRYEASLLNNLGVISYLNGDYEGAIQSFTESVKIYEQYDISNTNLSPTLNNISSTYAELNYPSRALQYCYESVKYAGKYGNAKLKATSYIGLASNLITLHRLDSGMAAIRRALELTYLTKDQYDLLLCYINLGWYFEKRDNNDSSLFYYKKGLPLSKAINSPYDISSTLNKIANIEMGNKDFNNAKIHLDSAEWLDENFGFRENKKDWYQLKSEFYNLTGNFSLAVTYLKKYDELKDSLLNESRLKRIDFLEERYQSEKKQQAINELEKDQKIQQLYLRQKSRLNYILIGSLAGVLLLGFLLYRNYRQKQQLQQQKIRELEKDSQLMAVDAMLKGQEEERSRLAKDLHDGLGGMLSGVKFSLNNMKDNLIITPDNMAVFERSLDMIDTSIKELRRVAHNMMPEMLTKFGLDEALKEYCNSVNATRLLTVKYQSFGIKDRLESPSEIIIYRIIQELLNNILKHAVASEALVQLIREGSRLSILVEDNGRGFDTATLESNTGAGWMNIRSRVDYLKGRLDIHSETNKGTSVTIEFNV